jgi:membrane protein implicated in regulation of membrane protease activity
MAPGYNPGRLAPPTHPEARHARSDRRAGVISAPRAPASRVLARYLLFQVPGWVLVGGALAAAAQWNVVSTPVAWMGFALWLAKDAVLFPVLRRAYEPDGCGPPEPVGAAGVAEDALDDEGWVRLGAELWRARLARGAAPIPRGARVRVVGAEGLVLYVEADAGEEAPPGGVG